MKSAHCSLLLCGSCTGCQSQREYSTSCACLCTRCLSGMLPITLPACWRPPLTFLHGSSSNCDLVVPRTSRKIGDRAFSVATPRAWNWLPADLKLLHLTASFNSKLKSFLFHAAHREYCVNSGMHHRSDCRWRTTSHCCYLTVHRMIERQTDHISSFGVVTT